jgi:hypothetical protein
VVLAGVTDAVTVALPAATVIERFCAATTGSASVTATVKLAVPLVRGVPLIVPEFASMERPVGSAPDVIDQWYGVVPFEACTVAE